MGFQSKLSTFWALGWSVGLLSLLAACQSAPQKVASSDIKQGVKQADVETVDVKPVAPPNWFANSSIQRKGHYIGYGSGPSLEAAKTAARVDLSKQLQSQVQSQMHYQVSEQNGVVDQTSRKQVTETSQAKLSDLVVLHSESVSGRYFVALGMDFRPLAQKVLDTFSDLGPQTQASLWNATPLFQTLKQSLGFYPDIDLTGDGTAYFLKGGDQLLKMKPAETVELFPYTSSNDIQFSILPSTQPLQAEQLYQVQFKAQSEGYLSYLQIFQTGDTALFMANRPIQSNQKVIYPNPDQYDGLVAELAVDQAQSRDLHLAILCPEKRAFAQLESVSTQAGQDYAKYLDKLPGLVKNCQITSQVVEIKR